MQIIIIYKLYLLINIANHNSKLNGNKKASNGISDFCCGEAKKDTPLKKYGALKSITSDLALDTLKAAKDIWAAPLTRSPTIPFHLALASYFSSFIR